MACPARTKSVYRDNFLTESSQVSGGREPFSNLPEGAMEDYQWP